MDKDNTDRTGITDSLIVELNGVVIQDTTKPVPETKPPPNAEDS